MGINQNRKGKVGERMWRDELRAAGFMKAHRGQQYCGGIDSPDVVCPEIPTVHWEVKNTQKSSMHDWMSQATKDASSKTPVVAWKKNHCEWLVVLKGQDFLEILKQTDLVANVFCPDCGTASVAKNGKSKKLKQTYLCRNEQCERESFTCEK